MIPKTFFQNANNPAFEQLSFLAVFPNAGPNLSVRTETNRVLLPRRNRVEGQRTGKNTKLRRLAEK